MKRHLCRHSGRVLDTYTELRRHVESRSTPSVNSISYSVAPPAVTPPSDHAKKATYVCEKCGETFGRWDNLQRQVRYVCSGSSRSRSSSIKDTVLASHVTPTPSLDEHRYSVAPRSVAPSSDHSKKAKYVCEKCGVTFGRWNNLQRHVRYVCSGINSSSSSSSRSSRSSNSTKPSLTRVRNVKGI